jgi:hypothetical protein
MPYRWYSIYWWEKGVHLGENGIKVVSIDMQYLSTLVVS